MLANALVIPTERPPQLIDLKRALLSYDQILLPAPEDRDVIPPNALLAARSGIPFPIAANTGPVRPLGKVPRYDEEFQRLLDECAPALQQNSIKLLPAPQYDSRFTIGAIPLPPGTPNPKFVYQIYRDMASQHDFVAAAGRGLEGLSPILREDADTLAPRSADDGGFEVLVNNQTTQREASLAAFTGVVASEEERTLMTRLCAARIGTVVKHLAISHNSGVQPFSSDPGIAAVIQLLSSHATSVVSQVPPENENRSRLSRLSVLHDVIVSEFLNDNALREMSVSDVLKFRTKEWGQAGEARERLNIVLREIAESASSEQELREKVRTALRSYQKERAEWDHKVDKLGVQTICDIGLLTVSAPVGMELAFRMFALGSVEALLVVGGVMFKYARDKLPEVLDVLHQQKQLKALAGYSLQKPYAGVIRGLSA